MRHATTELDSGNILLALLTLVLRKKEDRGSIHRDVSEQIALNQSRRILDVVNALQLEGRVTGPVGHAVSQGDGDVDPLTSR